VLTAWSNDCSFDHVFARQVEAYARPGSVLVAISTSGPSPNVVAAAEAARRLRVRIIALTGATGGALEELADCLLSVPATDTAIVQQVHIVLYHYICNQIETALSMTDCQSITVERSPQAAALVD
jgi:D-sedoheptulose 7-phosphate isomerase